MSLDLGKTALQIERMTDELRGRQNDRQRRLVKAIRETEAFDTAAYEEKRARSRSAFNFLPPPGVNSPPSVTYEPHPPGPPSDFCVAAVDGSHIDVDRHLPVEMLPHQHRLLCADLRFHSERGPRKQAETLRL